MSTSSTRHVQYEAQTSASKIGSQKRDLRRGYGQETNQGTLTRVVGQYSLDQ